MEDLKDFQVINAILDKVNGGNGKTPIYFEGESAVEKAEMIADCYCWCSCGWSGTGTGTGWI
ncbi:MAG: hypothetical protein H6Q13_1727 [Bacteroidetes bacterium]|nr:hypothetical protein [Bacteroidota bacterium]